MAEVILKAENLKKVYGGTQPFPAVNGVSFELEKGECLGIVGESGSGKSTIARLIARLIPLTDGRIFLHGKDITDVKGRACREIYSQMQMVFQMPTESFDPKRTLGDGVSEGMRNRKWPRPEIRKRTEELFEQCGLSAELIHRYPHEVSGGQCQRAAIARALAVKPQILILDEPTSALDVTVQKQILDLMLELKKKKELSFLLISHDLAFVQQFCDKILVLQNGVVEEYGETENVLRHPRSAYTQKLIASVL